MMYSIQSTLMKVKAYTILVKRGLYTNAQQLLLGIGPVLDEEIDFVYAQNLFLQSMLDRQFVPTSTQLDDLRAVSLQTQPINGYARAVLHWFTDERADVNLNLPFALPRSSRGAVDVEAKLSQTSLENNVAFSIYPNPVQVGSSLTIANLPKGEYILDVYDFTGQKVMTQNVSATEDTLPINLQEGLYFISIPLFQITKKLYVYN